jgi:hypothetical protein
LAVRAYQPSAAASASIAAWSKLPQVVRADEVLVHRLRDLVADHRDADQRAGLGVVHRPRVGHRPLLLVGLGEDLLHRVEVVVLARAAAQAHDRHAVPRAQDVAQSDPRHRRLLHVLAHVYIPAAPRRKYRPSPATGNRPEITSMRGTTRTAAVLPTSVI